MQNFDITKGVISFSAGRTDLNPKRFRLIGSTDEKMQNLLKRHPELVPHFTQSKPIFVNCYPASLGGFPTGIFVDTYLRMENFSRALMLSGEYGCSCVIMGQPLTVAQLLYAYVQRQLPLPANIILAIGGYTCPHSLELFLSNICGTALVVTLHFYGIAEADFGCLVAKRNSDNDLLYHSISSVFIPHTDDNHNFSLLNQQSGVKYETGDKAVLKPNGYAITAPRENPELLQQMERWSVEDWQRKTGYVCRLNKAYHFQLREDVTIRNENEMLFWDFCSKSGYVFLNKPEWL